MAKKQGWAKRATLAAAVTAMLAGCSTDGMKRAESDYSTQATAAKSIAEKTYSKMQSSPMISKASTFWVEKTPLPPSVDPASQLPPIFKNEVSFNLQTFMPLQEVFARINKSTGMMFTVAQDVYEADPSKVGVNLSAGAAPAPQAAANVDSTGRQGSNAAGSQQKNQRVDVMVSDLIYKGSLAGLLDTIATKENLAWRFDGEKVHFFRYESRIFRIDALAGSLSTNATVSTNGRVQGDGNQSTSASTATQSSTSMKTASDLWADVSSAIQSQLSARGKMSMMPSTGQVTVTDTPDQLRRIEQYIRELNRTLGKQVAFNIDVYSVELKESDGYGIDWTAVWSTVADTYKVGFQSGGSNTANMNNLFSVNLMNSASGNVSNWNGSSAVLAALSTLGKTSLVTSTSVVTLNNIPVPVAVTNETSFVKRQSTTMSTQGTAQTSIEPGSVITGFNMNLVPRLTDGERMMLQFSMDLSDLVSLTKFTSPNGDAAIQLPQMSSRNFLQRVSMKSGETLVLSGFQQTASDSTTKGMGSPDNWQGTGSKNTSGKATTLVIMITPYVMATQ